MVDEGSGSRKLLDKTGVSADYVEVMFAKTVDEAKECCALLTDTLIPSRFEESTASNDRGGVIFRS